MRLDLIYKDMKYLKRFDESVNVDIINNCKDILQPIIDSGTNVSVTDKNYDITIQFGTYGDGSSFSLEDYMPELEHLNSYLEEKGYKYKQPFYKTFKNRISNLSSRLQLMDMTFTKNIGFGNSMYPNSLSYDVIT